MSIIQSINCTENSEDLQDESAVRGDKTREAPEGELVLEQRQGLVYA